MVLVTVISRSLMAIKNIARRTRIMVGAVAFDLAPFLFRTLLARDEKSLPGWAWNRNRRDQIRLGVRGEGIECLWEFTRSLHITDVFPRLSSVLVRRMLSSYPIDLRETPSSIYFSDQPVVSFIIGHRGTSRLPHLLLTLMSIAGQSAVPFECIVVEQSHQQELGSCLPKWVRYHFTQTPSPKYLYNRSWALNEGAKIAKGSIFVLHDGDMLVPTSYAYEMKRIIDRGDKVVNLKRFIAFLDERSTEAMFAIKRITGPLRCEQIMANATAGGSIGIDRAAFFEVGAMDEAFVGWGGEDTEFWDRCQTLQVANNTYMPLIHLWHPSQPGKAAINGLGTSTADYFMARMQINRDYRIAELTEAFKHTMGHQV